MLKISHLYDIDNKSKQHELISKSGTIDYIS